MSAWRKTADDQYLFEDVMYAYPKHSDQGNHVSSIWVGRPGRRIVVDVDKNTLGRRMQRWAEDFVEGELTKDKFVELVQNLGEDVVLQDIATFLDWTPPRPTHTDARAWTVERTVHEHFDPPRPYASFRFNMAEYAADFFEGDFALHDHVLRGAVGNEMKAWAAAAIGVDPTQPITRAQFALAVGGVPDVAPGLADAMPF